ncbi:hypothetical protein IJH02_03885 [Candidatus Saccharibacteria bacterium]|nr:hypothetical protein [Candidatus Saccharibacteria bacterium]
MRENSKHTSDERYLRTEAKIQNTIDTMLMNKRVVTKVRDFCVLAEINPATFYGHYESIGDMIFERDRCEAENLRQYLTNSPQHDGANSTTELEIAFQKTFRYISNHKTYFKSIIARDNIRPYKNLVIILKPTLLENWHNYHVWDENRELRLRKIGCKLIYEVAGEYNEWIEYDEFDATKIRPHIKHLIYLTNTACQRLDR